MALTDPETCSWCTQEVEDSELTETKDGARICLRCLETPEGELAVFGPKCRTRTPEVHYAGEFPMSCYDCHITADS